MLQPGVTKRILGPDECHAIDPRVTGPMWIYKYVQETEGWTLSIATQAAPQSGSLSLGGFRIVPRSRLKLPGFDADREALDLAHGMGEKVQWTRLVKEGGPRGMPHLQRIVGGKCVLLPTQESRVGQPRDKALLEFATASFVDCVESAGIEIITGQDLGHGMLHDRSMSSLQFAHARYVGSVLEDTSKPTGEGNFAVMKGAMRALGMDFAEATVGLIGCGNVGRHVFERARAAGAELHVLELRDETRDELDRLGAHTFGVEQKGELLAQQIDVLVVNAAGGSLDDAAIDAICANEKLRLVCGSENLAMPAQDGEERLRVARTMFCPTEFCGMMGYLTAVEEYIARKEGKPYDVEAIFEPAGRLEGVSHRAAKHVVDGEFELQFGPAIESLFGP